MADRGELIAQFCAITGAAAYTAENYLEAHEYELERAIDFYLEHPPQDHMPIEAGDAPPAAAQIGVQQPEAYEQDAVEIPDNDDDEEEAAMPQLARQRQRALVIRQLVQQQMEGQGIPAAMLGSRAQHAHDAAHDDMLDVDEEAAEAGTAAAAGPGPASTSYHHQHQQRMLAHYQQLGQQRTALQCATEGPQAAETMAITQAAGEAEAAAVALGGAGVAPAAAAAADMPLELPEGINLEEARMLEAAMLGVPYQGRIPDFSTAAPVAAPPSPGAMDRRNLQAEQDAAYEESLALDRAKQESIAAAQAAEEARRQAEQEAAQVVAHAEEQAKQGLIALLAAKQQRLLAEPGSEEADSVSIVVRMPDGSRKRRRFRRSDQLQAVFDFVDLQCNQAAEAAGDAGGGIRPGSYRLVTQFPRRVYVEGTGDTLQEAGISSDSALFLELL